MTNEAKFFSEIKKLIKKRKEGYKTDNDNIISNYGTEQEATKGYNGRQLLELLQNAYDAQSTKVLIKLETQNQTLTIANKGKKCKPFSIKGIKSIMYSNLSTKVSGQFIGNKGLGFRSIINWADKITISTNNLDITFSPKICQKHYNKLVDKKPQEAIKKERKLAKNEVPMAVLAIPKLLENPQNDNWTTKIIINYKDKNRVLHDIRKQIKHIKPEILLFLKNLQKIELITDSSSETIKRPKNWAIEEATGKVPNEYLDGNNKNNQYELKIAYNEQLDNKNNECLYCYFPTKIDINMPFIVHGTFDLNSSRNQLVESEKNKFVVKKLVDFIIKTAKNLKAGEANYQTLEFLKYQQENKDLRDLGFYETIDDIVENDKIYPCIDNEYRKKSEVVCANDWANFVIDIKEQKTIPYLLKPYKNINSILNTVDNSTTINNENIEELNEKISDIDNRVKLIELILKRYDEFSYKPNEEYQLLIDENSKIISLDNDVYTPANKEFSLPYYVHIQFINKKLNNNLVNKGLADKLSNITNIKPYNSTAILQKIIISTNIELKKENSNKINTIKEMVQHLYKNYHHELNIADQEIQLLDQNQEPQYAKNLYLSKTYPSGELTNELFGDIFGNNEFLADVNIFGLNSEKQQIEDFFLWLGVNRNTRLDEYKGMYKNQENIYYRQYLPTYQIYNFNVISQKISPEKLILWILKSKKIKDEFEELYTLEAIGPRGGRYGHDGQGISHIKYQLKSIGFFVDYLIDDKINKKISKLVNNNPINYQHDLFKKYDIHKAKINSLLLEIGAVENFANLSINKVNKILQSLPEKNPDGKLAQKIYIEALKHEEIEQLSGPLLFAKKGNKKGYFLKDEIHYAGISKLPKEYIKDLAIFDYPKKSKAKDIVSAFKIKDLTEKNIENIKPELAQINDKFQKLFEEIKPFILAYRVESLEDKEDEAEKLNRVGFVLCKKVSCEIDKKNYDLSDYDYLIKDKKYLIKIPDTPLKKICKIYDFFTVFGDIIGLVFVLEETTKYQNCIKDNPKNIKRDIEENIGTDAINEAKELLGIATDFYYFWHPIYILLDKNYTDEHNNNLERIKQELDLNKDYKIDYADLGKNGKALIDLFKTLRIEFKRFNQEAENKIDLSPYHQKKLKDCFNDNQHSFKQCLYQYCFTNNKQAEYLTKLNQYKAQIDNYATEPEVDYRQECEEFVKNRFGFKLKKIDKEVDIQAIYETNKAKFNDDDLHEIESLLYFEGQGTKIKKWIEKNRVEQKQPEPQEKVILPIVPTKLEKPTLTQNQNGYPPSDRYNPNKARQQKRNGDKAEQKVYDSLVDEYGEENVIWKSKANDNAGYDIGYRDKQEKWWSVEVKTLSNNIFYMSKNEKQYAEENKEKYKVFLVEDTIIDIENFDDLEFNPEKFSVEYKIPVKK